MLIHVIDFEGNLQCGIIEYGIATLKEGKIENTQTGLCRPEEPIRAKDILLHGLRDEMLENHAPFSDYQDLFYGLRRGGVFAAHHAPVENSLLNRYWNVVPTQSESSRVPASGGSWGPWIDSRLVAQHCFQADDYSLGALVKLFELESTLKAYAASLCPEDRRNPHCALYDAIASALLLLTMQQTFDLDIRGLIRSSQTRSDISRGDFAQEELF
jgi:DNA polymerase III epsilon subunit-like protein